MSKLLLSLSSSCYRSTPILKAHRTLVKLGQVTILNGSLPRFGRENQPQPMIPLVVVALAARLMKAGERMEAAHHLDCRAS